MKTIKITKMQGLGNDFVLLDYEEYEKTGLAMDELARKLCDRHFGVGADGMIIPNCELRAGSLADPLNANNSNTNNADIGWYFTIQTAQPRKCAETV